MELENTTGYILVSGTQSVDKCCIITGCDACCTFTVDQSHRYQNRLCVFDNLSERLWPYHPGCDVTGNVVFSFTNATEGNFFFISSKPVVVKGGAPMLSLLKPVILFTFSHVLLVITGYVQSFFGSILP